MFSIHPETSSGYSRQRRAGELTKEMLSEYTNGQTFLVLDSYFNLNYD